MAQYPCDHHGARYSGFQQTVYPAIVDGIEARRKKQRLCPSCFSAVVAFLESSFDLTQPEEEMSPTPLCQHDDCGVAIFATVYAAHQERRDYYARACRDCAYTRAEPVLFGPSGPVAAS